MLCFYIYCCCFSSPNVARYSFVFFIIFILIRILFFLFSDERESLYVFRRVSMLATVTFFLSNLQGTYLYFSLPFPLPAPRSFSRRRKSYQISRIMSFYIYNCYFFLSNLQEHTRISPFPFPLSAPRSFLRTGRTKLLANSTFPSIGKAIVN